MRSDMVKVTAEQRDALFKLAFEKRADNANGESGSAGGRALGGGLLGAFLGGGLGALNHYITPTDEDEEETGKRRLLRHILGGALMGGAAGAGLGYLNAPNAVATAVQELTTSTDTGKPDGGLVEDADKVWNWTTKTRSGHTLLGGGTGYFGSRLWDAIARRLGGTRHLMENGVDINPISKSRWGRIGKIFRPGNLKDDAEKAIKSLEAGKGVWSRLTFWKDSAFDAFATMSKREILANPKLVLQAQVVTKIKNPVQAVEETMRLSRGSRTIARQLERTKAGRLSRVANVLWGLGGAAAGAIWPTPPPNPDKNIPGNQLARI